MDSTKRKENRERFFNLKFMQIPQHLGVIIDGNRRWAREKGLPDFMGHKEGLKKVQNLIQWCNAREVKILTLFVFSTENWNRSKIEVDYLMKLFKQSFDGKNIKKFNKEGIRIRVIGQRERLSEVLKKKISEAESLTKNNNKIIVNFALSYGGRMEIAEAIKNIFQKNISSEEITEDMISQNLWTPDVDLIIRTGKEQRISNFLIWQAAYAELCFFKKYWPDFTENDLDEIFTDFSKRQRRFGK